MTDDDLAFVRWVNKRHAWLWRHAFQRQTWRPLRVATANLVALSIRAHRVAWRRGYRPD